MTGTVAVLGPGRIGRQIALAFSLGGWRVVLADVKGRAPGEAEAALTDARREIMRDLGLMAEEGVIADSDVAPALARIEDRIGLGDLRACSVVQEAVPERIELKRELLARLATVVAPDAIVASGSSTISPAHLVEGIEHPERFLSVHWLNPAHIIPLVEVVPSVKTSPAVTERTLAVLERLGKVPVRCGDSPGFIGPRIQALLMNEAVRLVEGGWRPRRMSTAPSKPDWAFATRPSGSSNSSTGAGWTSSIARAGT
jgi:3-hydroxybutyryl-CoA dehydrogenase